MYADMKTEIVINDMEFFAYHGFYPVEQEVGCRYTVDLTMRLKTDALESDRLSDTLNYEEVYRAVREEMEKPSKLIEHVAKRILERLRGDFPIIEGMTLQLYKHNPPLGGQVGKVSVRLTD